MTRPQDGLTGPELDLTDPAVREMAERNHTPAELWTIAGDFLGVHCAMCSRSWPCPTRRALTDQDRRDS